jgi:putative transposase
MIEPAHQRLSIAAQCRLLSISRSSYYYAPVPESEETLALMRVIDAAFLDMPWYGSRQMVRHLRRGGYDVGRRRVRRLMGKMGLSPIYQRPRTSDPHPQHRIYPYLLRKLEIVRPNHVWCADVTYIPMRRGFLYLVAVMDWATRKVLAWRLSNTMDAGFCVAALEEALARFGRPEIFNTDQGSQFCGMPRCGSAWTAEAAGWTTCSSSGCGDLSNMNAFISTPSRPVRSCALALLVGSPTTTRSDRTRV